MSWVNLQSDIMQDLDEVQLLVDRRPYRFALGEHVSVRQPVESYRRAYRERNRVDGRCSACPRPRSGRSVYCDEHRRRATERALRSYRARRATPVRSVAESQEKGR